MDNVLIFGHKKPDTDSVTSAIALAYLKNQLGYNAKPYVLGNINNETKYVLNYFNVPEPKYLNDVKLQVKDLNYEKKVYLDEYSSIYDCYTYMTEKEISALPIIDKNNIFIGAISMKEIVKYLVDTNQIELNTSYDNILNVLHGEQILRYEDEIKGNIIFASFKSTTFIENIHLNKDTILIVGDRHSIIEYAIICGVKLIIITGNGKIKDDHIEMAKKNHVNIIYTEFLAYKTSKLIPLTNYVKDVLNEKIITVNESEYVNEFIEIANKTKRSNYPVLNRKKECLGILKYSNINEKNRKKVILVDHNEDSQSVDGLDEAEIIEVVDHHRINTHVTNIPINFRIMPLGSTNTIIFKLFNENKIDIPKDIAGIMLAGILSDTLLFKSSTTTKDDMEVVEVLKDIAEIDYVEFAKNMFEAGCSLSGRTTEEIIFGDLKNFNIENKRIGVSQLFTTNANEILNNIDEYLTKMEDISRINEYYIFAFFITDLINEGSYMLYSSKSKDILEQSFDIDELVQGYYLPGIMSRKKQIIPKIMETIEKK